MATERGRRCPVQHAGALDNTVRKWLQDPKKILGPYIQRGMTVLDLGCGPGFFTVAIAEMVGESGTVVAADVQQGMLDKLRDKIKGTDIEDRIQLHPCGEESIGFPGHVDLVVAFYVIHEVSNKQGIFLEVKNLLRDGGWFLFAEPKYFHVSRKDFEQTVRHAIATGFEHAGNLRLLASRGVVLRKTHGR